MASAAAGREARPFPVLVFDPGDGAFGQAHGGGIAEACPAPAGVVKPVAAAGGPPGAVLIPSDLALDPPAPLRKWMRPITGTDWSWRGTSPLGPGKTSGALPAGSFPSPPPPSRLPRSSADGGRAGSPPAERRPRLDGVIYHLRVLAGTVCLETLCPPLEFRSLLWILQLRIRLSQVHFLPFVHYYVWVAKSGVRRAPSQAPHFLHSPPSPTGRRSPSGDGLLFPRLFDFQKTLSYPAIRLFTFRFSVYTSYRRGLIHESNRLAREFLPMD